MHDIVRDSKAGQVRKKRHASRDLLSRKILPDSTFGSFSPSATPFHFADLPLFGPGQSEILPKLFIQSSHDPREREADRIADTVMRMKPPDRARQAAPLSVQRKCAACEEEEEEIQRKPLAGKEGSVAPLKTAPLTASSGPGRAMDPGTRSFMEQSFGVDFGHVRIHADGRAARMSQGLGARAFTYGSHIYFNANQYDPDTRRGRRLLAHELAHVVQQSRSGQTGIQRDATDDARLDDPNFLICLALCYIGLPPSLWRTLVHHMLQAISEQYREQYGEEEGAERFGEWSAAYSTWSFFNKAKAVITFLGESRIGPITIRLARARAIRMAAFRALSRAGIRSSVVIAASQIIRKVALVLELVWAAGCFLYCTAEQVAVFIRDLTVQMIQAVAHAIQTLSRIAGAIGEAIGEAVSHSIRLVQAKMNIHNWIMAPELSQRGRNNLRMIALSSGLANDLNTYLSYLGRPLNNYDLGTFLDELSQDLTSAMRSRGGISQSIEFTPDFLGGLSPLTLIELMVDYGFITYRQDPESLAAEMARQAEQVETE